MPFSVAVRAARLHWTRPALASAWVGGHVPWGSVPKKASSPSPWASAHRPVGPGSSGQPPVVLGPEKGRTKPAS